MHLVDVQKEKDYREVSISRVGVRNLIYPIRVEDRQKGIQHTTSQVSMSVSLPKCSRATHMSRFVEILHQHQGETSMETLREIVYLMREHLEAKNVFLKMEFPYFIEKTAPVSGKKSLMNYQAEFVASTRNDGEMDFVLGVSVPVTILCPCSKSLSEKSAHNQRCEIQIKVRYQDMVWIEELVEMAEASASCEVYSLLKREDEKFVTEKAYENPRFVEDVVRETAGLLKQDERILWYRVEAESMESIHNHNAFAVVCSDERGDYEN